MRGDIIVIKDLFQKLTQVDVTKTLFEYFVVQLQMSSEMLKESNRLKINI